MSRIRVEFDVEESASALSALAQLMAAGVDPGHVVWVDRAERQTGLFDAPDEGGGAAPPPDGGAVIIPALATASGALRSSSALSSEGVAGAALGLETLRRPASNAALLSQAFVRIARQAAMNCDPARFGKIHRMALRIAAQPRCWLDRLDPEVIHLHHLAREVSREIHKMHAFVRFRRIADANGDRHVAWFEPRHAIVRAAVPFFVARFAAMPWSILTPRLSVNWEDGRLSFGPGAQRHEVPDADAGEALWLAYYRSIFNPSRLNRSAMLREMPRRYWRNLPEAAAISELMQEAPERSARMQEEYAKTLRRLPTPSRPASPVPKPLSAQERLRDLQARARHCSDCPLAAPATQMVWGEGQPGAALMLVGEQPGDREDLVGRPFVGPAGELLRDAMRRLGWATPAVYMTNAVKHFRFEPRGKRRIHKTPGQREMLACQQWLEAEIRLVRPRAIVALGATAAFSLLGETVRMNEMAGSWLTRSDGLPVLLAHHPAAVLRRAESGAPSFEEWVQVLSCASEYMPGVEAFPAVP